MFLELVATLIAGVAGAGAAMLLNRILGGRLPRWFIPVAAGAAMLTSTIWSEYTWFGRTVAGLPEGVVVIQPVESRAFYRPWTYVVPFVNRFAALDQASLRTNDAAPGQRLVNMVFMQRWTPPAQVPTIFDCMAERRTGGAAPLVLDDQGRAVDPVWVDLGPDDPALKAACEATL